MNKQDALTILKDYEWDRISKHITITDEKPSWASVYLPSKDMDVWYCLMPSETLGIGSSRIVCVDKTTSKIIFDGYCGE